MSTEKNKSITQKSKENIWFTALRSPQMFELCFWLLGI